MNTSWTTEKPLMSSIYCMNDMFFDLKMNKLIKFEVAKLWCIGTRIALEDDDEGSCGTTTGRSKELNEGASNCRSAWKKNYNCVGVWSDVIVDSGTTE